MTAIRTKTNLHFGLYHCLYEWLNPLYINDKANNWKSYDFVRTKAMPALYEIVNKYQPDIVWSDGDYEAPDTYWGSTEFLAWLYNDSPIKDIVVTNDRWGINDTCKHGGYWTCKDRYMPTKVPPKKWENTMTIDKGSWGFRRNANLEDYLTIEELLAIFIQTVSLGGNMLMNVGPQKDGVIAPILEERLRQVGAWMGINGEAIRGTNPWTTQNDTMVPDTWYTKKDSTVYALVLTWPSNGVLSLSAPMPTSNTTVNMIGYSGQFEWQKRSGGGIDIMFPNIPIDKLPVKYAWVLTLSNLENA
ncbi:hypothetical protein LOTGIDRAFT_211563 [Lottia gigantea]|uniref:alpha-L-fucosidase n=1 Tax=Lottia gigantea TaxID=225164 RepID=V4B374_LOTGI|nr:hypothetical protein LOTGIDRAFT_211563 [Lottia gigantea]ESP04763.1 hypothetical protein LOTGIDRAFT_211563 [Lottia gigantea]